MDKAFKAIVHDRSKPFESEVKKLVDNIYNFCNAALIDLYSKIIAKSLNVQKKAVQQ